MKYLRIEADDKTKEIGWFLYETLAGVAAQIPILAVSDSQEIVKKLNSESCGMYYACTKEEEAEMFSPSREPKKKRAEIKIGSRIVMSKETDCLVVHNKLDNQLDEVLSQANEAGMKIIWAQNLGNIELTRELFLVRKEISLQERQVVIVTFGFFVFERTLVNMTFLSSEEEGVVRVMQGRGGSPDEEFELFRVAKTQQDFNLLSIDWYLRDKFPNAKVEEKVITVGAGSSPPIQEEYQEPIIYSPIQKEYQAKTKKSVIIATTASSPPARQEYRAETKKTAVSRSRTGEFEKRVVKVKQRYRQVRKPL